MNSVEELMIHERLLTDEQLKRARILQQQLGSHLGDALLSLDLLPEEQIMRFFNPVPPVPVKIADTGLDESFLVDLSLKAAYLEAGTFSVQSIAETLCLPFSVVTELIESIRTDHLATVRSMNGYGDTTQILELTQRGRERAEAARAISQYVGAAPVPLQDYTRALVRQTVREIDLDRAWIHAGLQHLVIGQQLLDQLGPAFASGRSIFLYGPPGTGKTSIAEALGRKLPGEVYIPQAITVSGQIIRLFDSAIHKELQHTSQQETAQLDLNRHIRHDPRWKKCHRPVVMVGGELTPDMLEFRYDESSRFYEAPIHMKAGNGMFILDDFGRQRIAPRQLLNRWIIPLERGTDFPSLHTGMKLTIPFDQITVFCTNLNPLDLVDDAFLRRIRHKIHIRHQTEEEFKEIMRRICEAQGIACEAQTVEYLLENYYRKTNRPMAANHPRDLMEHIVDRARFLKQPVALTPEAIDSAAANYFVKL
ncbi:AAA family ATPase [Nitrosomonas sp. ANs5]|uniref:AAA family ATPase n=1 Tax=Nitrosomonas sp. ANs5 TaxID=3423941 RepID=UPI003D33E267